MDSAKFALSCLFTESEHWPQTSIDFLLRLSFFVFQPNIFWLNWTAQRILCYRHNLAECFFFFCGARRHAECHLASSHRGMTTDKWPANIISGTMCRLSIHMFEEFVPHSERKEIQMFFLYIWHGQLKDPSISQRWVHVPWPTDWWGQYSLSWDARAYHEQKSPLIEFFSNVPTSPDREANFTWNPFLLFYM